MSFEELRVILVVYTCAIAPIIYLIFQKDKLPTWVFTFYIGAFLVCALGWELWFTYGWVDGDSVNLRRSDVLNYWLPQDINWLINSLADAGTICVGGLYLVWVLCNKNDEIFIKWNWKAFALLMVWCVAQNLGVELFLYHDQLAEDKLLSWAPMAPTGKYFNPELFSLNGRSVMLQSQLPWLILPAALYKSAILLNNRHLLNKV